MAKKWRLRDLKDKIVILNFWASWCSDCKEEKKSIQAYLNKNGNSDDLVFITVLYKDNPITVSEMAKKEGFSFPVLIDDGVISTIYGIKGVPETFLIDKKGVLRHKIVGPVDWSNPHIVPHLKKSIILMGKPGQPKKVLLFIATLFKEQDAYYKAIEILEDKFGQILVESSPKLWNYSDYYTPELGSPIKRRFIFF